MGQDTLTDKYNEAKALFSQGKYDAAIELVAPYTSDDTADRSVVADMYLLMVHSYWNMGSYDEARANLILAKAIIKEAELYAKLPGVLNSLGLYDRRGGNYRDALIHFLEGLVYAFRLDNKHGMIGITSNMALIMMEMHDFVRSERGYDAALRLCGQVPLTPMVNAFKCQILINKCQLWSFQGRASELNGLLAEINEILASGDVGDKQQEIETYLTYNYVDIGEYEKAYTLLRDKKLLDSGLRNLSHAINLISMGMISKHLHHDDVSYLQYMGQALSISYEQDIYQTKLVAHGALQQHYLATDDTALAKLHEEKHDALLSDKSSYHDVSFLSSMLDANINAVENQTVSEEKVGDLLPEHDFLINTYSYISHKVRYHIPLRDIVYIESQKNYLLIYTVANSDINKFEMAQLHTVRSTLKEFMTEIETAAPYFVKVHASFVINMYWFSKFPQKKLSHLSIGDRELPVSQALRPIVREKMNKFLLSIPGSF